MDGRIDSVEPGSSVQLAEAELDALEAMIVNPPEPAEVEAKPNLKVHRPMPEPAPPKVHAIVDDIVFDDDLLARMMANLASHGMTAADIFG